MFGSKSLVYFIVLCLVHGSVSKPHSHSVYEGRGIGSTLWSWITYPFSWWSSDVSEIPLENDQIVEVTQIDAYETIEIGRHNVTIWCNDQTCTTMKCDRFGCVNITCNIYDTDLTGECRNYNTVVKPEEPITTELSETISKPMPQDQKAETTSKAIITSTPTVTISSTENDNIQSIEERPLELEAVISSTVTDSVDKEMPDE